MSDETIRKMADALMLAGGGGPPIVKQPLAFQKLLDSGALRVTHQGIDANSFNPDPSAGFSLVSGWNEQNGKLPWPDNPGAYPVANNIFASRPQDIADYKYRQIVQSAQRLGLSDADIFLPADEMNGQR